MKVINRALDGVTGTTALHLCFGYAAIIHERPPLLVPAGTGCLRRPANLDRDGAVRSRLLGLSSLADKTIILGVIDLADPAVESPDVVVERVRRALPFVPAQRLVLAPTAA